MNLDIRACNAAQLPTALLLEADPHLPYVQAYLADGHCYLAELDGVVVGLYVLQARDPGILELMNIAVAPNCQAQGIGTHPIAALAAGRHVDGVLAHHEAALVHLAHEIARQRVFCWIIIRKVGRITQNKLENRDCKKEQNRDHDIRKNTRNSTLLLLFSLCRFCCCHAAM
jgi:GNAT superfamily N-acetyltransferase